ncbi:MAG: serpin family protein [Methanomicrobiaceae archaeon]|uniref:Serine protease inhibitor (Serpin family) n=1 Tax=hydrocarbon metagenome TaxID=938273 RepID=A0A0W8FJH6_9ZZZZ|nr:serpin family protein [Methanomicrobiaceae archaeon]MDD5420266.1 serpin family protein [Methanomicrobiaceae archaeon]
MKRISPTIFVLAVILALGCIVAGCADMQGAISARSAGEETLDDQSADAIDSVAAGNNRFACDLYRNLADDPKYAETNLFFSPYSISSALAITYEGARGTTADEIRSVLHLPENDTLRREGFSGINARMNSVDAACTLRTANALWAEETYQFLPEYIETAERYYGANATNIDFINAPEESRSTINRWVEERTEEKIRDLLPPGSIDPVTRLVITNAIYFEGTWVKQFDENLTRDDDFRVAPERAVRVPMMQRTGEDAVFNYTETGTVQVLGMPYAHESGRQLSMLVILPNDENLTAAEAALDPEQIGELRQSLVSQRVDVFFPKFTLETEYSLPETLAAMGMPTAFSGAADLSGMDGTRDLFISDVIHKAFVDVDEEGTEAAAATAVVVRLVSAPQNNDIPVFRADHPFVFLILDDDTGNILFIGRVANPA